MSSVALQKSQSLFLASLKMVFSDLRSLSFEDGFVDRLVCAWAGQELVPKLQKQRPGRMPLRAPGTPARAQCWGLRCWRSPAGRRRTLFLGLLLTKSERHSELGIHEETTLVELLMVQDTIRNSR